MTFNVLPGEIPCPSKQFESLQLPGSRHCLFSDGPKVGQWRPLSAVGCLLQEGWSTFQSNASKALLRCKDCPISPRLANASDVTRSKREGGLWAGLWEVGASCSVCKMDSSPGFPSGSSDSSFGCLVFSCSWKNRWPSPCVSAEQCVCGQLSGRTAVSLCHLSLSLVCELFHKSPQDRTRYSSLVPILVLGDLVALLEKFSSFCVEKGWNPLL